MAVSRLARPAPILALAAALGAALRLFDLGGRSLWVDEIDSVGIFSHGSPAEVLAALPFNQMPLYFLVAWPFRGLAGTDAGARAVAAACGILVVPAVFLCGRRLAGAPAGAWAALLAASSAFLVWYAQDATAYSALLLASTLAAWAAHRAAERARLADWLLLALAAAATAYVHYSGLVVVAALYAWVALDVVRRRDGVRAMGMLTSGMLVVLALAPWTPELRAYVLYAPPLASKTSAPGLAAPAQALRLAIGLSLLPLTAPLAAVGGWALARAPRELGLLLAWGGASVLALVGSAGLHAFELPVRYFAVVVPPLLVLAGAGVGALVERPRPWLRPVAALALLLAAAPQLAAWHAEPKDDWRAAAATIRSDAHPGSVVLTLGYGTSWSGRDIYFYMTREGLAVPVVDGRRSPEEAAHLLVGADPVFAVFNSADGPADVRLQGRSATGDFDRLPPAAPGIRVSRETGVTVVEASSAQRLLEWASTAVPDARTWAQAVAAQRAVTSRTSPDEATG